MRQYKYQVYINKDVPYVGGKMWAVAGMSWREYVDDGEPENPIRQNVVDLDICEIEDFEKGYYTKTSWQGKYIQGKFHLREWTGLKDKNGKEIYEGDVLLVEDTFTETVDVGIGSVPVAQTPDNHLCEVVFKDGAFKFVVTEQGENWWKGEYNLNHEDIHGDFEIIGNIYENPELLNKK